MFNSPLDNTGNFSIAFKSRFEKDIANFKQNDACCLNKRLNQICMYCNGACHVLRRSKFVILRNSEPTRLLDHVILVPIAQSLETFVV